VSNTFYRAFDTEVWGRPRKVDYRTPFQVDRDRIIHSSAFRQLQSKTQVFLSGEYDFYRTRLTHSLEVAQIGRSICHYLRAYPGSPLREDFHLDPDLVEAACLAHDLGHPPFGHAGERTLHALMREHGGFEGNAQTLRLLTETLWTSDDKGSEGMAPTRALLDGVLKYKTLLSEDPRAQNRFIYDAQAKYRAFVWDAPASTVPSAAATVDRNGHRSIECQIMDWADDTAYSLHDISDAVRAGFLTFEKIERWADAAHPTWRSAPENPERRWIAELEGAIKRNALEQLVGKKIGTCVSACRLEAADHPLANRSNRHAFRLVIEPQIVREVEFYKTMAVDVVFHSPPIAQMEHNGSVILRDLFRVFVENYLAPASPRINVLPPAVARLIDAEADETGRLRRICDHIASMTDGHARRTWRRLFDPDFASMVDLG
jgi:dGTPase